MLAITQTIPRAERGTGALTIVVDGHWNSRIAGNVGSFGSDRRLAVVSAFDDVLLITPAVLASAVAIQRCFAINPIFVVYAPNNGAC
jgi:hypothetical protein